MPGSLFFALKGDQHDGNLFAARALENGASYAIVDNPACAADSRYILVRDALKALQELAAHHRRKLRIPVIAITGTNGKTTTKELVAAVLSTQRNVEYTRGNLNNHIGVPLTLLTLHSGTEIAVVEMGANHPGEIDFLCHIADPGFGLITNVGKAHLEGFGSLDGILKAKSELYRYVERNHGTLFINGDNPLLDQAAGNRLKRIQYGLSEKNSIRGKAIDNQSLFLSVEIWLFQNGPYQIHSHLTGGYNVENLLAAAAIGDFFGISPYNIQSALENYQPANNRSQLTPRGSNTLIVDAYNANPASMMASLSSFFTKKASGKVVILGDMLELGDDSIREHQQIVDFLAEQEETAVYLCGSQFCQTNIPGHFNTFRDTEELIRFLQLHPVLNSLVLIKGSRGMKMEQILNFFN